MKTIFLAAIGLTTFLLACGDDTGGAGGSGGTADLKGQGEPCTEDAQCADGLTCDLAHEEATCEVPHNDTTPQSSSSSGGDGGDGGGDQGGGGAGGGEPSACETLCACLETTCSAVEGYPFADAPACVTNCEAHTDEEISCWGGFCDQASTAADPDHLCEHAWGDLGLEEC